MEWLIQAENNSVAAHRWLSFLRLMMSVHPRQGAEFYAVSLGLGTRIGPGWNAVYASRSNMESVRYILIDADAKAGRFTREKPDVPDDQIRKVYDEDIPALETTQAWRQTLELAELLKKNPPAGMDAAWVDTQIQKVLDANQFPLRGGDASVDDRIRNSLSVIIKTVNNPKADLSLALFLYPVNALVQDYLDFKITRRQTSNILAVILSFYIFQFRNPVAEKPITDFALQQLDHLIELAVNIGTQRHEYGLGSYSTLTYLALLWAETALLLTRQWNQPELGKEFLHLCQRKALYIDEYMAHELQPALIHPVFYTPFGVGEGLHGQAIPMPESKALYRGLGTLMSPPENWERIQAYNASAKHLGSDIQEFTGCISDGLKENLHMFLMTMKLGHSEP